MLKLHTLFFIVLAFVATSCAHQQVTTHSDLIPITVLHTNDVHGHAWSFGGPPQRGGLAAHAAIVKQIRSEMDEKGGIVLLLSAGDINTGVPESDLQQAQPDIQAMNFMQYDAMVLGNHEFDKGFEQIVTQKKWAKFPILSANITYKDNSQGILADPYTIIEKGGLKFAVIGLTTDNLGFLIAPKFSEKLKIENPIVSAQTLSHSIQADVFIALTHLGVTDEEHGGSTPETMHFDNDIAKEVPTIPLIIGGHSHTLLPHGLKIGNTLIAQAGSYGEYLGRVDLIYSKKLHKIVSSQAQVFKVEPSNGEDGDLKSQLDSFKKRVAQKFDEVLATAEMRLTGGKGYNSDENALGNLMCDALRDAADTDIAIFNSGGIRASIEKGPIQLRHVLEAFPFSNTLVKATLSGNEFRQVLSQSLKERHHSGSFLQVSGVSYTFKGDKLMNVRINNLPLNDSKKYTLATNNFVMSGGDGLTELKKIHSQADLGMVVSDIFANYLIKLKNVKMSKLGRITIVK